MEGHRVYPFRGWRPFKGLPAQPGWEPVGYGRKMWTEFLMEQGWTSGYVTDNPHILSAAHAKFRGRFDRAEMVTGQVPNTHKGPRKVSQAELDKFLPPSIRGTRAEPRMLEYLRWNAPGRDESEYNTARVFKQGEDWIQWARTRQPFALVIDSFDAHEPWDAPVNLVDLYDTPTTVRRRADPAVPHAGRALARPQPLEAPRSADEPPLRGRGDDGGPCDGPLPVPAGGARAGRQHARGRDLRPRSAARRVRLGGQALLGDAPAALPRAVRDPPPGGQGEGPRLALLRLDPRRGAHGPRGARLRPPRAT